MNLSPHFELDELLRSPTAQADGFTEQFSPSDAIVYNLASLCGNVLEALRVKLGKPIQVTSGYRCPRLNSKVGGEPTSQHLSGEAADTVVPGITVQEWYQFVKTAGVPFDQLIIEHDSKGDYWVHISYNPTGNERGICLIGTLQPTGGTLVQNDGVIVFNKPENNQA